MLEANSEQWSLEVQCDVDATKNKKEHYHAQLNWLDCEGFMINGKTWLQLLPKKRTHVYCLVCRKLLVADLGNIQNHAGTKPHLKSGGGILKPSPEQLKVPDKLESPTERRVAKATI